MPDLERVLAPLLDRPLAEPEGIAELERRASRLRRRRRAWRLAATATVTAAVLVGAVLVGSAGQVVRTTPPADAPDPQDAPPAPPAGSDSANLVPVGSIVTDTGSWQLLAGHADGNFCTGLKTGAGTTSGCGDEALPAGSLFEVAWAQEVKVWPADRPVTTLAGDDPTTELDNTPFLWGAVAKEVATIRLELGDGRRIDVGVTGSDAGLPVNFYAVPVPPDGDAVAMAALDADGRELERRQAPFWPQTPPPPCLPPAEGPEPCLPAGSG